VNFFKLFLDCLVEYIVHEGFFHSTTHMPGMINTI